MKKCKYCTGDWFELASGDNVTLTMDGNDGTLSVAQDWDYYNDEEGSGSKTISINYCPMCGRKLGDD